VSDLLGLFLNFEVFGNEACSAVGLVALYKILIAGQFQISQVNGLYFGDFL
jgi:hypothetical protein